MIEQWRYFSATDRKRADDLTATWRDPTVNAVFTSVEAGVGGRVLEAGFRFSTQAKWTLGFSESSSLLLAQWVAGLPGAVHSSLGGSDEHWQRSVNLLSGKPVKALQGVGLRAGTVRGPLLVTNLTVATHPIGTPRQPSLNGALLVLEDVWEALYCIYRMLTQWRGAGLLKNLASVACGRFSWAREDFLPGDLSMKEILKERLGDLGIPLVLNLPLGQGQPNYSLPLSALAQLGGRQGQLSLIR